MSAHETDFFELDFDSCELAARRLQAWLRARGAGGALVCLEESGHEPIALLAAVDEDWPALEAAAASILRAGATPMRLRRLDPEDNLLVPARPMPEVVGTAPVHVSFPFRTPHGGRGTFVVLGEVEPPLFLEALARRLPVAWARQRDHEAWIRELLQNLRAGVLLIGAGDAVRFADREALELLGLDRRPRDLEELAQRAGAAFVDRVHQARISAGILRGELPAVPGGRGEVAVEVRALTNPRAAVLVRLRDLSERQRLERQHSEFMGVVGHELRTPITSARSATELVRAGEAGEVSDEQARLLDLALRNLDRLDRLVNQLLDAARARNGRPLLRREDRDLGELLDDVFAPAVDQAARHRRHLQIRVEPGCRAWVDPLRVQQIAENLIGNALKFTDEGGAVRVRVRRDMPAPTADARALARLLGIPLSGCEIEVVDDGRGMDAASVERAFDAFYQEGDPLSDRPMGAGLGLAIVRELVQAHAGQVELDSEKGRGTTVRVWLPSDRAAARLEDGVRALCARRERWASAGQSGWVEWVEIDPRDEADFVDLDRIESDGRLIVRVDRRWALRMVADPESPDRAEWAVRLDSASAPLGTLLAQCWPIAGAREVLPAGRA